MRWRPCCRGRPATCYFLYDTVENTFNDIWHVTARRSWFRKFLIFYPVASGTTSPALAALIKDLEEARQARIGGITIAELMPK